MVSDISNPREAELRFGPFRLLPAQQALFRGAEQVRLGSRAFELLVVLAQRPGELITKDQLLGSVWPGIHVDETALRVHVSALRKALGTGAEGEPYIVNVVGRGYRFSSPVTVVSAVKAPDVATVRQYTAPRALGSVVGRDDAVASITLQLSQHRLVTIVGSGGIGKTTVAMVLVERLAAGYPDAVHFLDLSPLTNSERVPASLALSLGLPNLGEDPSPGIIAVLREKRMLLVLDCCERVVEGAAMLVERIVAGAPGVHILATSREPMRALGERVIRLPPLLTPPVPAGITAEQAAAYPAVQLFVDRASASLEEFTLNDANAPLVAALCTRLDGIALAIELVAGHVNAFDLPTLAAMVDGLSLLGPSRRTAVSRHQTLRAVLDWSFETIAARERLLLRRLAVFVGSADLHAVVDVVVDDGLSRSHTVEALGLLVDKSLVAVDRAGETVRYRLPDTTRMYATEKLRESGEADAVARRHALHYLATFSTARRTWTAPTINDWLAKYLPHLCDVGIALDWAFSPGGDPDLGTRLADEALPVMSELSLVEDCRNRTATALVALRSLAEPDPLIEMRLSTILGVALMYTPGPQPQTFQAWERVLEIAEQHGVQASQARSLWGLWTACVYTGRPRDALGYARRYSQVKINGDDAFTYLPGERIIGVALHLMGEQAAARRHIEGMLANYVPRVFEFYTPGFQLDQGAMARVTLVRVLWILGFENEALAMLTQVLLDVRRSEHAISICYAIIEAAVPVLLLAGDIEGAERQLDCLQTVAEENRFAIWQAGARALRLAITASRGIAIPIRDVRNALSAMLATGYTAPVAWLCGVIAEAGGPGDELAARMALVDEAMTVCERSGELWGLPELLRIRAKLTLLGQPAALDESRQMLARARGLARDQGAKGWEVRIANTEAPLLDAGHESQPIGQFSSAQGRRGDVPPRLAAIRRNG